MLHAKKREENIVNTCILVNILLPSLATVSFDGRAFVIATSQPVSVVTTTVIAAVTAAVTAIVVIWLLSIGKEDM
jgi:hypothetical protein